MWELYVSIENKILLDFFYGFESKRTILVILNLFFFLRCKLLLFSWYFGVVTRSLTTGSLASGRWQIYEKTYLFTLFCRRRLPCSRWFVALSCYSPFSNRMWKVESSVYYDNYKNKHASTFFSNVDTLSVVCRKKESGNVNATSNWDVGGVDRERG